MIVALTCDFSHSFVLPGLDAAPERDLRRLLALLVLERHPGLVPELRDALREIVQGDVPDDEVLERGYTESGDFERLADALVNGDRDELLLLCRDESVALAGNLAATALEQGAGFGVASDELRMRTEREAREYVEQRWAELRR